MFFWKLKALTAAALLVGLLALACGPASLSEQGAAAQAETPAPAETPTPTVQPTATPYPPGYVKPTDLPTWTPFPTLPPDPTPRRREAVSKDSDASGVSTPAPTPTLPEQVTQFARGCRHIHLHSGESRNPDTLDSQCVFAGCRILDSRLRGNDENRRYETAILKLTTRPREKEWKYDAIARVRAVSHRNVTVPRGIEWPPNESPFYGSHTFIRTSMRVIETYRGVLLPDNYEIVSFSTWENTKLDIDRDYILFVRKQYVAKEEYPDDVTRHRFNKEQLDAFGGTGGILLGVQVWIVDENTAWRVPIEHFRDTVPGSNWEAAKAGGENLPVAELEAAIAAAFK